MNTYAQAADQHEFGPWNPGLRSQIPRAILPLSTLYRRENSETTLEEAEELADFCGLPREELARFRPSRLVVHELLIRVMADIAVSDGEVYADLGINFRQIASKIHDTYITPQAPEFEARLERELAEAARTITALLKDNAPETNATPHETASSIWAWLGFGRARAPHNRKAANRHRSDAERIAYWNEIANSGQNALERSCGRALATVATAITGKHGRLIGTDDLITKIAITIVSNSHGSALLGRMIEPLIDLAVREEGFRRLPAQERPVVMNVKGASAAGKSTLRPLQRDLAARIDVPWEDFALISPDIWRKFLLDYDSLGDSYKYAGPLSGHELEIIDQKLDAYMAAKAAAGRMSHLLIDRFRFDSFVPESDGEDASKLLTRFGDLVYMFFVITPPEATVERAWRRGLEFGRYKAVDDLLDHNVDAFTGMPDLFFTWALRRKKRVHYEFLDNSVPKGEKPRTVAFGWNGKMTILDVSALLNIDRFRQINVDAKSPAEVYDVPETNNNSNATFIDDCVRRLPEVAFADPESGLVYAATTGEGWSVFNTDLLKRAASNPSVAAVFSRLGLLDQTPAQADKPRQTLHREATHTLGAWSSPTPA